MVRSSVRCAPRQARADGRLPQVRARHQPWLREPHRAPPSRGAGARNDRGRPRRGAVRRRQGRSATPLRTAPPRGHGTPGRRRGCAQEDERVGPPAQAVRPADAVHQDAPGPRPQPGRGVVAAFRAGQLGDLGLHQPAVTSNPTAVEGASRPSRTCSANVARCPSTASASGPDSPRSADDTSRSALGSQGGWAGWGVVSGRGRVRTWHWGSSRETWRSLGRLHEPLRAEDPASPSTDPGTTS
jgi:hypothetical protein